MRKLFFAIAVCVFSFGVLVPTGALGASVAIPFARPSSSNSGYIFLTNEDGSKWFAFVIQAVSNNTELGGASSSESQVSQQDANSALEALGGAVYLQLELEGNSNTIEALGMAYVDTDNRTTFHSGEKINKERSDIIYIYQYAFYDGSRIYQSYGIDPGKVQSISFPAGWKVNPALSATSFLLYGEIGGNISLKVVRHRISDNIYLGGPYGLALNNGGPSWSWKNDQIAIVGDVDAHIATTPSEKSQAQQIAESISGSADALHSLADSIDVSKPSVSGGIPDTPAGAELANNPVLTTIGSLWSNDILLTLSIISLTMTTIIILLRGTHG